MDGPGRGRDRSERRKQPIKLTTLVSLVSEKQKKTKATAEKMVLVQQQYLGKQRNFVLQRNKEK